MSVFIATILENDKIAFAADSRVCEIVNGETFWSNDNATKLYHHGKVWFYCSGVMSMAEDAAKDIMSQPVEQLSPQSIIKALKKSYNKHITKLSPDIKKMKYLLQFVIPFNGENGDWEIHYYDSEFDFEPQIYKPEPNEMPYVWGIGKGANIINPYLKEAYTTYKNVDGEYNITKLYIEAFEKAAAENCGGEMTFVYSDGIECLHGKTTIKDSRALRKRYLEAVKHGEGDGVIVSTSGKNISGVAELSKPNGSYDTIYRNSNYAQERRLLLKDEGIELSTETGDLVIGHDNGSFIKLKSGGDIEIKAIGKIYFNGVEFNFDN
ncbi:hypothetical protein KDC22_13270 [Paenibacillus tritici]|uniref:hypothetical protein n=1 Tax=Paenibacillus tritici TaxID=1873425 RepID=UPI001BA9EA1E|nr:hypothetical protein [Paenibacillus tritici]QUL57348.1 hypothetical protein KDC22_13270 [Paenibacillus tritici]